MPREKCNGSKSSRRKKDKKIFGAFVDGIFRYCRTIERRRGEAGEPARGAADLSRFGGDCGVHLGGSTSYVHRVDSKVS